jgi:sortase A
MTKSNFFCFLPLRNIGNYVVVVAIIGIIATFGPALYYEIGFKIGEWRGIHFKVADNSATKRTVGFADILAGPKEQILSPIDTEFNIIIGKIGANARIFPNVDPSRPNDFLPILKKGVAHAKGTVFPGMKGNIYLFAHSTDNFWDIGRYNAIFYLIKNLAPQDEIVIFFQNKRHNYIVSGSKIVESTDVSFITQAQGGKEQLILQTCWPPGTTWKRLLVFAEPK